MTTTPEQLRESVRARYADAATTASCCGSVPADLDRDANGTVVFGAGLYTDAERHGGEGALAASLGCGVPTAVADLHPGEVVLDLGSGAGGDALISARRVGPTGRVIGLDMTTEMLTLARANAAAARVDNVEFVHGYLEEIPLPDDSVDVVLSNCVLNLAADKNLVLAEAARVLRAGGRLAFSDVIADENMDAATRADMAAWTGCIAGALTQPELTAALSGAGFTDVEIRSTHRVHPHAQAAIIRATLPVEPTPATAPRVLFVCVSNAGKSQMAAALMRQVAGPAITADSAGTTPGSALNALSAQVLDEVGIDITGQAPTAVTEEMIRVADLVVTLGDQAHVDPVAGTDVETWLTDEPSLRGIDGIERMRLVRDDIAARVRDLHARLLSPHPR